MKERVTLKDIAKSLNISIGTVGRAIHGKHDINPETKRLILDKIEELNYRPNKYARSLSVKNMKRIAVIMPYNSFFWHKVKEGVDYASNEMSYFGTHVEAICLDKLDGNIVLSYLYNLKAEKYDGVILVPVGLDDIKEKLNEFSQGDQSLVLLNDDVPGVNSLFYIGPDNILIGNLAGELTGKFSKGVGKCLVVSNVGVKSSEMPVECKHRVLGFQQVIESEYPQIEVDTLTYVMYVDDAYGVVLEKLRSDHGITAIYSADGFLNEAALAVKDSRRTGLTLVGHEMSDEVNRHLHDGIISAAICQNPFLQGYYALKHMMEFLIDKKKPMYNKMYINFNIFTKYNTYGNADYVSNMWRC